MLSSFRLLSSIFNKKFVLVRGWEGWGGGKLVVVFDHKKSDHELNLWCVYQYHGSDPNNDDFFVAIAAYN